jgi:asparagine N-glycosylation enzyme membrane subunit Stt3
MSWLLLWVTSVFILAYLPWRLQRRFLEGVHVALCILAAYGFIYSVMPALAPRIDALARRIRYDPRKARWLFRTLVVIIASVSNLYLVASHTVSAVARHPKLFRSHQETVAAQWLAENTAWDDVILAGYEDGNWIVGLTGHRVVLGHWGETIDFAAKAQAVEDFYAGRTPVEEQRALLDRWRVRYVYLNEIKPPYNTADVLQGLALQKVFEQGPIYIYEVDP